jgi:hypothetical protein
MQGRGSFCFQSADCCLGFACLNEKTVAAMTRGARSPHLLQDLRAPSVQTRASVAAAWLMTVARNPKFVIEERGMEERRANQCSRERHRLKHCVTDTPSGFLATIYVLYVRTSSATFHAVFQSYKRMLHVITSRDSSLAVVGCSCR